MDAVELGTVGEWVSGVAASVLIVVTWLLWRHERRERRHDDERRASRAVNAWIEVREGPAQVAEEVLTVNVLVVVNSSGDDMTSWSAEVHGASTEHWDPPVEELAWRGVMSDALNGALWPGRRLELQSP